LVKALIIIATATSWPEKCLEKNIKNIYKIEYSNAPTQSVPMHSELPPHCGNSSSNPILNGMLF
jgi:hypothetical protein